MIEITIHEKSCRGCQLCVEICPTDVLEFDESTLLAKVAQPKRCIECLSCGYMCPSHAISHDNYHIVKNFYWDADYLKKLESFL